MMKKAAGYLNGFQIKLVAITTILFSPIYQSQCVADGEIQFQRDIRPILSDHCFACHGPDQQSREGGVQLNDRASAFGVGDSGLPLIVPGDSGQSLIVSRMLTDDADIKMPPPHANKDLNSQQIDLLRRWIDEGATWEEHWSFSPPVETTPPPVDNEIVPRNSPAITDIDAFLLDRLKREGLTYQEPASKEVLIRRVTFDLTGLPPTISEIEDFLADDQPMAYQRLVDRLLRSPRYAEHMARFWLDAARYGDTHGLHLDNYREMWAYRDWVVEAFNRNLPYDQFVIEQLAGDMLPDATTDQIIASGFNRCHVTTSEGGSIEEEVRVRNVVDRVVTTGTVFLGLTMDCTRCHDHKYDPLTMKDFYSMYAFFNNMDTNPLDGNAKDHPPVLRVLDDQQRDKIAAATTKAIDLESKLNDFINNYQYTHPVNPEARKSIAPKEFVWFDDALPEGVKPQSDWGFAGSPQPVFSGEKSFQRKAPGLTQFVFEGAAQPLTIGSDDILFAYVYLDPNDPPKEIMLQWNDGSWEHRAYWGGNKINWGKNDSPSRKRMGDLPPMGQWTRLEVPASAVGLAAGSKVTGWACTQFDGTVTWDKGGIVSVEKQDSSYISMEQWLTDLRKLPEASWPAELKDIIAKLPELVFATRLSSLITPEEQSTLTRYFVRNVYQLTRTRIDLATSQIAAYKKEVEEITNSAPTTLISKERTEIRPAKMLNRGEYDQPGEIVSRAIPAFLPPFAEDMPLNRLGLAKWMVDKNHPLTSRVIVNRLWQQIFGVGIVKTSEDFGSQGTPPFHPELLDFLAVRFMDDGWDMKQLIRSFVMTAAYQQSSKVTSELQRRDPENRMLARGPRYRLDAEMLRDQALAVSGLLNGKMGGPSVKPPQPEGIWEAVGYTGSNTANFTPDSGHENVHRRTLYTFIKRTAPPPELSILDSPSRESCIVRRERTNTPLQALMLMNDPQYFEAAIGLASRVLTECDADDATKAAYMFRLATGRFANEAEQEELLNLAKSQIARYSSNKAASADLLKMFTMPLDRSLDEGQVAAWSVVANLILNLDEVLCKN